jgi:hypothetical protein
MNVDEYIEQSALKHLSASGKEGAKTLWYAAIENYKAEQQVNKQINRTNPESAIVKGCRFDAPVINPPRILIACEESGIVRTEFTKLGADAWSCDILPSANPGNHLQCDVREVLNDGWDAMIAFPPCTHLAASGARWFKYKEREQKDALEFVKLLMNAPIYKIAIENPIGIISTGIRKPDQIIQPYYFGDSVPKRTCLWLMNLPPLYYGENLFYQTEVVEPEYLLYNSKKRKSGKSRYSIFGKLGKGHGEERSKTFPGIARAMAEQWMPVLQDKVL